MSSYGIYYPYDYYIWDAGSPWYDPSGLLYPPDLFWGYTEIYAGDATSELISLFQIDFSADPIPLDATIVGIQVVLEDYLDNSGVFPGYPILGVCSLGDLGSGPLSDTFIEPIPIDVFPANYAFGSSTNLWNLPYVDPYYIQDAYFAIFLRLIDDYGLYFQPAIDSVALIVYWDEYVPPSDSDSTFRSRGGDRGRLLWGVR